MTISHEENRVYNNIFVQKNPDVEVEVKEGMGKWYAYFNGANQISLLPYTLGAGSSLKMHDS